MSSLWFTVSVPKRESIITFNQFIKLFTAVRCKLQNEPNLWFCKVKLEIRKVTTRRKGVKKNLILRTCPQWGPTYCPQSLKKRRKTPKICENTAPQKTPNFWKNVRQSAISTAFSLPYAGRLFNNGSSKIEYFLSRLYPYIKQ